VALIKRRVVQKHVKNEVAHKTPDCWDAFDCDIFEAWEFFFIFDLGVGDVLFFPALVAVVLHALLGKVEQVAPADWQHLHSAVHMLSISELGVQRP